MLPKAGEGEFLTKKERTPSYVKYLEPTEFS